MSDSEPAALQSVSESRKTPEIWVLSLPKSLQHFVSIVKNPDCCSDLILQPLTEVKTYYAELDSEQSVLRGFVVPVLVLYQGHDKMAVLTMFLHRKYLKFISPFYLKRAQFLSELQESYESLASSGYNSWLERT